MGIVQTSNSPDYEGLYNHVAASDLVHAVTYKLHLSVGIRHHSSTNIAEGKGYDSRNKPDTKTCKNRSK
jgi:hypothetical protein